MNRINLVSLYFYLKLNFIFRLFLAKEIENAMSIPGLSSDVYDNDDLERELELLARDQDQKEITSIDHLPDVPINNKTKQKDDLLRELQSWAE